MTIIGGPVGDWRSAIAGQKIIDLSLSANRVLSPFHAQERDRHKHVPIDYVWLDHDPFKVENRDRHPVGTPFIFDPIDYDWLDHNPLKIENRDRHPVGSPQQWVATGIRD